MLQNWYFEWEKLGYFCMLTWLCNTLMLTGHKGVLQIGLNKICFRGTNFYWICQQIDICVLKMINQTKSVKSYQI